VTPQLSLVRETSIAPLLPESELQRWEASGVMLFDGSFHVVFDSARVVAVLDQSLTGPGTVIGLPPGRGKGFEDLARDPETGHVYLVVESLRTAPGVDRWQARLEEYDPQWKRVGVCDLDVPIPSRNKGIEGLTCVRRDGRTYLLALLEGNFGASGRKGRTPGDGRIHVLERDGDTWRSTGVVHLPPDLPFEDYSALAARGDRIVVVSQASAALWVGCLSASSWEVDAQGELYSFPRGADGEVRYGNVEGVSWLDDDRLVFVSDRATDDQPSWYRRTQESIHVFDLPVR
jgi:hypothetical protein